MDNKIIRVNMQFQTRLVTNAGTSNQLRLSIGGTNIPLPTHTIAEPGLTTATGNAVSNPIPYKKLTAADDSAELAISGDNAWAPYAAFVYGNLDGQLIVPLAYGGPGDSGKPDWVSQDVSEGSDRWKLQTIRHPKSEQDYSKKKVDCVVVLVCSTSWQDAGSPGPFTFQVYGTSGSMHPLLFSMTLPLIERSAPLDRENIHYLVRIPTSTVGVTYGDIHSFALMTATSDLGRLGGLHVHTISADNEGLHAGWSDSSDRDLSVDSHEGSMIIAIDRQPYVNLPGTPIP